MEYKRTENLAFWKYTGCNTDLDGRTTPMFDGPIDINREKFDVVPVIELTKAESYIKDLEYDLKKAYELINKKNKEIDDITSEKNTISLDTFNAVKLKYDICIAKLKKYGMWAGE